VCYLEATDSKCPAGQSQETFDKHTFHFNGSAFYNRAAVDIKADKKHVK